MHGDLPTEKAMEDVWKFDPDDIDGEAEEERTLLIWYLDRWLPEVVGHEAWDYSHRTTHVITDLDKVEGDASGAKKVLVPITGEAFGLLVFSNCRTRWIATFEHKRDQPGKKVPVWKKKTPDDNVQFRNKWSTSSSREGHRAGGGWSDDAFTYYNKMISEISKLRDAQKNIEDNAFKKGLAILQAHHNCNQSDNKKPKQKKRKLETLSNTVVVTLLDE